MFFKEISILLTPTVITMKIMSYDTAKIIIRSKCLIASYKLFLNSSKSRLAPELSLGNSRPELVNL